MRHPSSFVVAFFGLLALWPVLTGSYGMDLIAKIMIYALLALSLELLVGSTGLVCFGQAAFFGIGAYAAVLLAPTDGSSASLGLSLLTSVVMAGVFALAVGALSLRTQGVKLIGGGGGGSGYCESGGAGGYAEGFYSVSGVGTVAVTVGGGGSYAVYYAAAGNGGTTSFGGYLSASGGYGANQNYSHSGGHGGNSFGGAQFSVQGGAGCGHINGVGSCPASVIGSSGYFGGGAAHARNHSNLGGANNAAHEIFGGAPGAGGPANITDWGNSWTARGHSAGGYGSGGYVIVYSYK